MLAVRSRAAGVEQPYFSPAMKRKVRTQFAFACYRCGAFKQLQLDHHMPLCRGYALVWGNVVVLCKACNLLKGTKLPEDFYTVTELRRLNLLLAAQAQW